MTRLRLETASRAKIPVVIIDSGLNGEDHVSFVATDNYKGGVLAAREMGRILEGKGKVIVLRYQVGSASTDEREAGFVDTIKKEFPNIQIISEDQYSGATRDSAYQASQNLLNRFGNEVQGVFGPCEPVAIGLMLALKDIGVGVASAIWSGVGTIGIVIVGYWLFGEQLNTWGYVGVAMIIAGVIVLNVSGAH